MTGELALRRARLVGVVVPAGVGLLAVGVQVAILGDLPAEVATHWGPSGAEGFSPAWTVPAMTALLALALPIALGSTGLRAVARGERGYALRLMPALATGLSTLMGILMTGTLWLQRGLADAAQAPTIVPLLVAAMVAAVAAGVAAGLVQPRESSVPPAREPVTPVTLAPGETAVWVGRAETRGIVLAALAFATIAVGATAVISWVVGDRGVAILVAAITVVMGVLVASFTVFHVRVDRRGLTVTSAGRLVRLRVPAADVSSAAPIHVSGLAQFGGYGIRSVPGATSVVLRDGEALEVTRPGGRRFVVTVDDAAGAAAMLTAVAARA